MVVGFYIFDTQESTHRNRNHCWQKKLSCKVTVFPNELLGRTGKTRLPFEPWNVPLMVILSGTRFGSCVVAFNKLFFWSKGCPKCTQKSTIFYKEKGGSHNTQTINHPIYINIVLGNDAFWVPGFITPKIRGGGGFHEWYTLRRKNSHRLDMARPYTLQKRWTFGVWLRDYLEGFGWGIFAIFAPSICLLRQWLTWRNFLGLHI